MKTKNLMIAGIATLALGTAALIPLSSISANEAATVETTFIERLASKLGLSEQTVESAITSTKDELRAEREATREAAIAQAVSDNKLTQRQADILNSIDEARETLKDSITEEEKVALKDLTLEERRAQRDELLVDALNKAELNTNLEELQTTLEAAKDANILPAGPQGGKGLFAPRL